MKKNYHSWLPFTPLSKSHSTPKVVSSSGIYLTLENGQKVLDMVSSWWVSIHGHGHPYIANAVSKQAEKLEQVIYANFTHDPAEKLQQKLSSLLPKGLNTFFFSDNGSTAVEVAIKMAYQYWQNVGKRKKKKFFSFEGGYHGDTLGAMSIGHRSLFTRPFTDLMFDVTFLPFPETWIGDLDPEEKEKTSLDLLEKILIAENEQYAALMIEPLVQGAGGMRICRELFLQKLVSLCKKYDILLIYDEVMTGFGRTGEWFSATKSKTSPDIMCLSKALTGGFLPMSLTVVNEKVFQGFCSDNPSSTFYHGHSYTANSLGCAAALASIELLEASLPFQKLEKWHQECLAPFSSHALVSRIRTLGTIAAFTLECGENSYLNPLGKTLQALCLSKNLFIRPLGNVVYFMPPYITTKEELTLSYKILLESLNELSKST